MRGNIISCKLCPRLRRHCEKIAREKRRAFSQDTYWGKPVPNFGSTPAPLLIVGLAPAAHGANRTGRMFTGDRSGDWLYRALYRAGFANQATSTAADDGLALTNCLITAVAHCAPPDNKPTPKEISNCRPFLSATIKLAKPRVILALGALAWNEVWQLRPLDRPKHKPEETPQPRPKPKFSHAAETLWDSGVYLLASYHPSQQNTFTGRLTEPMLDAVMSRARHLLSQAHLSA